MSYLRKEFNYLCHVNMKQLHKYKYMYMIPLKNLARKWLITFATVYW